MDIDQINQNFSKSLLTKVKKQSQDIQDIADKSLKEKELKDACAGFEAIFLNTMIKSMRETLPGDSLFEESHGMNIYKSMHDQYLSEELSTSNFSTGIKEFLYNELKDSI